MPEQLVCLGGCNVSQMCFVFCCKLKTTGDTQNYDQQAANNMSHIQQLLTIGQLTKHMPATVHGQRCAHSQKPLADPGSHSTWQRGVNFPMRTGDGGTDNLSAKCYMRDGVIVNVKDEWWGLAPMAPTKRRPGGWVGG